MKSSHSGTPILSPLVVAVVLVVEVAALLELLVVELLLFIVSVLLHPISTNAHNKQKAKKVLISIGELLVGLAELAYRTAGNGIEELANNTRDGRNLIA